MAQEIIVASIVAFSNLVTFLFTKKRYKEDVDQKEIDNLKTIIEIQQNSIDFLNKEIINLRNEINELRQYRHN